MKWSKLKIVGVSVLSWLFIATTVSAVPTTELPYDVDASNQAGWWSPLEVYGGTVYMAFNGPGTQSGNHKIQVAKKDGNNNWSLFTAKNTDASIPYYTDNIGHNQPSIARDGSGYLHLFGSMHHESWHYFRSDQPGGEPTDHTGEMPDPSAKMTYPILRTAPNGDIYLMARIGDDGNTRRNGKLYRWDNTSKTWSSIAVFASETNRTVYPDDVQIDQSGNVHLLYEWSQHPAAGFRHKLSYLRYEPGTGKWYNSQNIQMSLPVTTATSDIIQDVVPGEQWSTDNNYTGPAIQGAKLSVHSGVKVVYRHRATTGGSFAVKSAWPSGSSWIGETVYSASETRAGLGITYTGSEKRIYYVTQAGTDRAFAAIKGASGGYTHESLAPGKPIERLAVVRSGTLDHLYLMDVTNTALFYGTR